MGSGLELSAFGKSDSARVNEGGLMEICSFYNRFKVLLSDREKVAEMC